MELYTITGISDIYLLLPVAAVLEVAVQLLIYQLVIGLRALPAHSRMRIEPYKSKNLEGYISVLIPNICTGNMYGQV